MSNSQKILAFFAHPDDETVLAGGTLALLTYLGVDVHYLCATRGEGGEAGEPPLCSLSDLGDVREKEFNCAVQQLGGKSAETLGYIDPRVGPNVALYAFEADEKILVQQIIDYIERYKIDTVVTHGSNGEYGHPAHQLVHKAAFNAVKKIDKTKVQLYTAQAAYTNNPKKHLMNTNDNADLILDVSVVLNKKINAALCHKTQHALFIRRTSEERGYKVSVPEVIFSEESLHRFYPKFNGDDADWMYGLLINSGFATTP